MIQRRNPVGFFGMVLVLEGTSVQLASRAAEVIKERLDLPTTAFRYLTSHGALDQDHIKLFENLMNRIDDPQDQEVIICAIPLRSTPKSTARGCFTAFTAISFAPSPRIDTTT